MWLALNLAPSLFKMEYKSFTKRSGFTLGNSSIQINPFDKRLNVKLEGTLSDEDDQEFFYKYSREAKLVPSSEFDIEVDCTELNVYTSSQMLLLETIYLTFKTEGFKQILFIFNQDSEASTRLFVKFAQKYKLPKNQLKAV